MRVVTTKNAKVALVGASGYVGEELVRLLLGHPGVDLEHLMPQRGNCIRCGPAATAVLRLVHVGIVPDMTEDFGR